MQFAAFINLSLTRFVAPSCLGKVVSLFLELADVQLRQLLNLSQLSVGLSAGESALIIDYASKPDVEVLWSKQAWDLALLSEILGNPKDFN